MRQALGFLSFVLLAGGVSGLLHEWLGVFRLFGFLRFLAPEGFETYVNLGCVVLGIALGAAGDSLRKHRPRA
jgi:hypothetical protein